MAALDDIRVQAMHVVTYLRNWIPQVNHQEQTLSYDMAFAPPPFFTIVHSARATQSQNKI